MRFAPVRNNPQQDAATQKLGAQTVKSLVKTCCTAFLVLGQNKNVIKRADVTKLVRGAAGTLKIPHMAMKGILNISCAQMREVMGMRVFETDASKEKLLLVNAKPEFNDYHDYSDEESDELIALFLMMVCIFTSPDETATDTELRDAVKPLFEEDEDFKKILDSLIKKMYLTQAKDTNQPDLKLISWGPRAYAETNPDNFVDSFMQLVDQGTIEDWPEQQRRIEKLRSIHTSVNVDPEQ